MQYGKNHDQRTAHARRPRRNNTPPADTRPIPTGGHGSEHAPTKKATEAEAERHAREAERGHLAAGLRGRIKAIDVPAEEPPSGRRR